MSSFDSELKESALYDGNNEMSDSDDLEKRVHSRLRRHRSMSNLSSSSSSSNNSANDHTFLSVNDISPSITQPQSPSSTNDGYYQSSDRSPLLDAPYQSSTIMKTRANSNSSPPFLKVSATLLPATFSEQVKERLEAVFGNSWMPSGKGSTLLVLYSVLLLLTSVGNNIYFKKMIDAMPNYVYFLNQITTIIFAPLFFIAVIYERLFTDMITPEMLAFPKRKFFWMGAMDSINGVLVLFGAVHTSGSNQALFSNAVIPITMFLSYLVLKHKYRWSQYLGATVIMGGIGVVLIPQLLGKGENAEQEEAPDTSGDLPFFNFLFLISVIPGAASSIYKEAAFKDCDIDANLLQAWVAFWQTLFGFVLIPLNTLKILGSEAIPWDELGSAMTDGWRCFLGQNQIVPPHCRMSGSEHEGGFGLTKHMELPPCDRCEDAWLPLLLYIIFNLLFNIFTILLIKYGSSTLLTIIMTLRLPLVQFAFSWRFINDPPDSFGIYSILGLLVILLGLVLYRLPTKVPSEEEEEQGIIPWVGHNASLAFSTMHHSRYVKLKMKSAHQIRRSLYGKLGVIPSPITPYSPLVRSGGSPLNPGGPNFNPSPTERKAHTPPPLPSSRSPLLTLNHIADGKPVSYQSTT